jgi:hypothetical protein
VEPFLHHIAKDKPQPRRTVALKVPRKLPRVLTVGEVQSLLDGCSWLRDRFTLAVLHDSCCRIGRSTWPVPRAPRRRAGETTTGHVRSPAIRLSFQSAPS